MRRTFAAVLGCAGAALAALGAAGASGTAPPAPVVAAYYAAFDPSLPVGAIDAARLTDVIYAFAAVDRRGHCALGEPGVDVGSGAPAPGGNFGALAALKAAHPGLRSEISIGGWSGSARFSAVAASAARRAAFVRSCVDLFLRRWPGVFDGFDIDWEFPVAEGARSTPARPGDRADATALLADFRRALDALGRATGRHYLLTVAMPAFGTAGGGAYTPSTSWDLPALARLVDWMNLMTYDLAGFSGSVTGFESPLGPPAPASVPAPPAAPDTIDSAVRFYEAAGVPADELVIGAPFYGHEFVGVHSVHDGLYGRFRKLGGVPSYAAIAAAHVPRRDLHWSPAAQEPWVYDRRTYTFTSFDDPAAMSAKAHYAVSRHLRGVMLWEIAMDDGAHDLLNALSGPVLAAR